MEYTVYLFEHSKGEFTEKVECENVNQVKKIILTKNPNCKILQITKDIDLKV